MDFDDIKKMKNFNMGEEIHIAGEFIYESARRMFSIDDIQKYFEVNSLLYNGSVGIERLQKVLLVMLSINSREEYNAASKYLFEHKHLELDNEINKYISTNITSNERKLLGLYQNYYSEYRYGEYKIDYSSEKLIKLVTSFFSRIKKFDFDKPYTECQFEPYRKIYINLLGNISKKYYELIEIRATELGLYTYEISSLDNSTKVFSSNKDLYEDIKYELLSINELIIYLVNNKDKNNYHDYISSIKPLELDPAMINEFIIDLSRLRMNINLPDMVETEYDEMEESVIKSRIEKNELISMKQIIWDFEEDDEIDETESGIVDYMENKNEN